MKGWIDLIDDITNGYIAKHFENADLGHTNHKLKDTQLISYMFVRIFYFNP